MENSGLLGVGVPLAGLHKPDSSWLHSLFWLNFISSAVVVVKEKPDSFPKFLDILIFFVKQTVLVELALRSGLAALLLL